MNARLDAGFADPVHDAQTCFRAVLDAMSHPGRITSVSGVTAPPPLNNAAGAVLLTLVARSIPLMIAGRAIAMSIIAASTSMRVKPGTKRRRVLLVDRLIIVWSPGVRRPGTSPLPIRSPLRWFLRAAAVVRIPA